MRKRIEINKKIISLIVVITLLTIGHYIYYKNNNTYEEFQESTNTDEFTTYKEKEYTNQESNKENEANEQDKEIIIIHITGEIKNWGVIELEQGSRVIDAVNKAGGFTEEADIEKVNLAYELTDGVKVYIPSKNEDVENSTTARKYITTDSGDNVIMEENDMNKTSNSLVNINEATQTELETLPGIGPSTALKIISYRQENGEFSSIEDIKNVSGIGDSKFENIRELICV